MIFFIIVIVIIFSIFFLSIFFVFSLHISLPFLYCSLQLPFYPFLLLHLSHFFITLPNLSSPFPSLLPFPFLHVLYTNARSLITKRNKLGAYVATEKPDVAAITETWANSTHLVSELSLQGYEIFQKTGQIKREEASSVTSKAP